MSYAVRKDGQGWRAVNAKDDCTKDEIFSETQPLPITENPQIAINQIARDYLRKTDWYVVRFAETGEPIPEEITTKRAESRSSIIE